MAILEFKNWTLEIGDKKILDDINLFLENGEVLAIIGESGSGKTSIIKSILGDLPYFSQKKGEIIFKDKSLSSFDKKDWQKIRGKKISYMAQNPMSVFNCLQTIGDHAYECVVSHKNLSKNEIFAKMEDTFSVCNLKNPREILRRYPFELSGGMLQRVMMGILLALEMDLFITDEPTSALDEVNSQIIIDSLQKIKKLGKAMIVVTHDYKILKQLADKILILKNGRIVEYGKSQELLYHCQNEYTKKLLQKPLYQHYLDDSILMDTENSEKRW